MLCTHLDAEGIQELRAAVEQTVKELRQDPGKNAVSVQQGEALAACAFFLLDNFEQFQPSKQPLVVGAVRYFAVADDPFHDAIFSSGFHDDMCVMNYVLEDLGIEDRYFDVR